MARSREAQRPDRAVPQTPISRAISAAIAHMLAGHTPEDAALRNGLPIDTLRKAIADLERGGWDALHDRPASRWAMRRKLTHEQELELHALISTRAPDRLGFDTSLWTRDAVRELVRQRTGIELPLRTLTTYLERWGFAPEKPLKSHFSRRPALMREWMRTDYPIIAMQARENNAVLAWWGTEVLAPRDRTRRSNSSRLWPSETMAILYIVTNRGHLQWLVYDGELSSELLISLMTGVVQGNERPRIVIAQDHTLFAEPAFIAWSVRHKDRLTLDLLPAELSDGAGSLHAQPAGQ